VDTGTCDSCGTEGCDDLAPLNRLYVTPEAWDQEEKVVRVEEVESWCSACRTHYPHQLVGPAGDAAG